MRVHRRFLTNKRVARPRHRVARRPLLCELLEDRRLLATFTVSHSGDAGSGTLRQAILDANATPIADTIEFAPALRGRGYFLPRDK